MDPRTITFDHAQRNIVPRNLEKKIKGARLFDEEGRWKDEIRERGLKIDLSWTELVELGAVVQLILLVEAAARNGINVAITLPAGEIRDEEARKLEQWRRELPTDEAEFRVAALIKRVARRVRLSHYLETIRFRQALGHGHIAALPGTISICEFCNSAHPAGSQVLNYESDTTNSPSGDNEPEPDDDSFAYKRVVPLTWLSSTNFDDLNNYGTMIASIIGGATAVDRPGIERLDAKAVSNVILNEIVENVTEHAKETSWALLAAWSGGKDFWQKLSAIPNALHRYVDGFLSSDKSYYEWFVKHETPFLDIIVGDSGVGALTRLYEPYRSSIPKAIRVKSAKQGALLWALERWSSTTNDSLKRGTRGLFLVDRIVKKYQGLLTIRSGNSLAGWDHGGPAYDMPVGNNQNELARQPGTLLRIRMPAIYERSLRWRNEHVQHEDIAHRETRISSYSILIGQTLRIEEPDLMAIRSALGGATQNIPSLLICTIAEMPSALPQVQHAIRTILRQLCELRHPGGILIIGLKGGWDLIETEINRMNDGLEVGFPNEDDSGDGNDHYCVLDPVLVIGDRLGQRKWVGVENDEQALLNGLLSSKCNQLSKDEIIAIVPDESRRAEILRKLRGDTDLVSFTQEGGLTLHLSFATIISYIRDTVQQKVSEIQLAGARIGKRYRTPSLTVVPCWFDAEEIIHTSVGMKLCAFAMSHLLEHKRSESSNQTFLAVDNHVSLELAKELEQLLPYVQGTERFSIDNMNGTQRESLEWEAIRECIIVVWILSSGETARCMIREMARRGKKATVLACVIDSRDAPELPFICSGREIPVVSLATAHSDKISTAFRGEVRNIDPITWREEDIRVREAALNKDLEAALLESNSLRLGHFDSGRGRHATFLVIPSAFGKSSRVRRRYCDEIFRWQTEIAIYDKLEKAADVKFDIIFPSSVATWAPVSMELAESVASSVSGCCGMLGMERQVAYRGWRFAPDSRVKLKSTRAVVLDWGTVSGSTLVELVMLAARSGATDILCCIGLSQISRSEEQFLQSITKLECEGFKVSFHAELFANAMMDSPIKRIANVCIKLFWHLPASLYDVDSCPVCESRRFLHGQDPPTDFLRDSVDQFRRELAPTGKDDVSLWKIDVPWQLPSVLIRAIGIRSLLNDAICSTQARQDICDWLTMLANTSAPHEVDVLAIVELLYLEPQWIRMAPLVFRDLRKSLVFVCLTVFDHALKNKKNDFLGAKCVVVLRTASKLEFAKNFANLFFKAVNLDKSMKALLLGASSATFRDLEHGHDFLAPLKDSLRRVVSAVEKKEISTTNAIYETVISIMFRVEVEDQIQGLNDLSPPRAWMWLRRAFDRELQNKRWDHCRLAKHMRDLLPGPDEAKIENIVAILDSGRDASTELAGVRTYFESLETQWAYCRDFINHFIHPAIARLSSAFFGKEAVMRLGHENVLRLKKLRESHASIIDDRFSRLVRLMATDPAKALSKSNWAYFNLEAKWFLGNVFNRSLEVGRDSDFIRFVYAVPTELTQALKEEFLRECSGRGNFSHWPEVTLEGLDVLPKLFVFAPHLLIHDIFTALFENIAKHAVSDEVPRLACRYEISDNRCILSILNSATIPKPKGEEGIGLDTLNARLNSFGGRLTYPSRRESDWSSFGVDIELLICDEP